MPSSVVMSWDAGQRAGLLPMSANRWTAVVGATYFLKDSPQWKKWARPDLMLRKAYDLLYKLRKKIQKNHNNCKMKYQEYLKKGGGGWGWWYV